MSFSDCKRRAIETYMLEKIAAFDSAVIQKTAEAFSLSFNTAYRYLRNLQAEGAVEKKRNGVYAIVSKSEGFTLRRAENELSDEQRIYEKRVFPKYISGLPINVQRIWDFSFTEMLNNAIDHSLASEVVCRISTNRVYTSIVIADNGIGIFRNIKDWFGLDSIEDAIGELFKGRVTTDSINHSGEGIYFTSKFLDDFAVLSSGKIFSHNKYEEIVADLDDFDGFGEWRNQPGTIVMMKQSNSSNKDVEEIIGRYSAEDSEDFSRTIIPVKDYFETYPVSRSQAKRLYCRLNVFEEIVLDFAGVSSMGQGFADEFFRVFQNRYPEIRISAINMEPGVERILNHIRR